MDAFAIHPYNRPEEPPTREHSGATQITIADYPKLVTLLDEAFRGTAQRGRTLPIYYTEFGVQTVVPPWKRSLYTAGSSPNAELGVSTSKQAAYYRDKDVKAMCMEPSHFSDAQGGARDHLIQNLVSSLGPYHYWNVHIGVCNDFLPDPPYSAASVLSTSRYSPARGRPRR